MNPLIDYNNNLINNPIVNNYYLTELYEFV